MSSLIPKKIYIIAGESSGDFIGSKIMQSVRLLAPQLDFAGIGGQLMTKQGLHSLFLMDDINMMGFLEILPHIKKLQQLIQQTTADIISYDPDLLITIDSPGFTYRVAQAVRAYNPNLKMLHIVAPSVWAYKANRAKKYAALYNHLLALLPFEPSHFTKVGLACSYIGHPIMEQDFYIDKQSLRATENIDSSTKVICVTAGSRKGEIERHLPIFCQALNQVKTHYPKLLVIFVLANAKHQELFVKFLSDANFDFRFSSDKLQSFAIADIGLAKSGTNTLEIAASSTPMIVAYKLNSLSYLLIKMMIKIKYASLINIIANREIIPEFLQYDCTPKAISGSLISLLSNAYLRNEQIEKNKEVLSMLGFNANATPSMRAAYVIMKLLVESNALSQHN